jgi:hypothetical protein
MCEFAKWNPIFPGRNVPSRLPIRKDVERNSVWKELFLKRFPNQSPIKKQLRPSTNKKLAIINGSEDIIAGDIVITLDRKNIQEGMVRRIPII